MAESGIHQETRTAQTPSEFKAILEDIHRKFGNIEVRLQFEREPNTNTWKVEDLLLKRDDALTDWFHGGRHAKITPTYKAV